MNLDLNLGSFVHPAQDDNMRHRLPPVWRHIPVPREAGNPPLGLADSGADDDEMPPELRKANENGVEGSFFDCNICLDLASEPVVTCCGHLFCWPCIYRWLFVHSNAKQCPICKGEVTMKTLTPIYGRVNRARVTKVLDPNCFKIPSRPLANRIESWRQSFQRDSLNFPIIDMVRRLDNNRFHLSRDPLSSNPQEITSTHLLNRIFTSRGMREQERESVSAISPDATVDLPNDHIPNLTSAESFLDSYNRDHPDERQQEVVLMMNTHSRPRRRRLH